MQGAFLVPKYSDQVTKAVNRLPFYMSKIGL